MSLLLTTKGLMPRSLDALLSDVTAFTVFTFSYKFYRYCFLCILVIYSILMVFHHVLYVITCTIYGFKGGRLISQKGLMPMEVKDAFSLMFMFGMFILALLTYMKKK